MPELLHQTVRLKAGAHSSPSAGMCAVELASVLAGDPFGDHPPSVCPVIAAFVRAYNDRLTDDRRQDLVPYAARIVGTRGDRELERARAAECAASASAVVPTPHAKRAMQRLAHGRGGWLRATRELAATTAARATERMSDETHIESLALLDTLIALGGAANRVPDAPPGAATPAARRT